jgi:hypothetical protein
MISRLITMRFLVFLSLLCFGCERAATAPNPPPVPAAATRDLIGRIHWIGKNKIDADTNAAGLTRVWSMPETAKLQEEAFDKLSAAPWLFLRGQTNAASSNLLVPLLKDLADQEWYVKIAAPGSSNQPPELVLAVRLTALRAGLWQTNIAAALNSLTGLPLTNSSSDHWVLKKHHAPNLVDLARVNDWTILGAAQDRNTLFDDTVAQLRAGKRPVEDQATNSLLEASIDFPRLAASVGTNHSWLTSLPAVSFSVSASGNKLWTTGELHLPDFTGTALPPWNIPTNLIESDFTSFMAARGVAPIFQRCAIWNTLNIGPPPDQFFIWALSGIPMETYFAIPYPGASNAVSQFTDFLLEKGSASFATNEMARFKRATNFNGLKWAGLPYLEPFVQSIPAAGSDFIFGGTFGPDTNYPSSADVFKQLYGATNLVYYDFERTRERIGQLIYMGQFLRFSLGRQQLAISSPGLPWLQALAPKLGDSLTTCETTGVPGQIKFVRSSTIGMTALELHLLVEELESFKSPGASP